MTDMSLPSAPAATAPTAAAPAAAAPAAGAPTGGAASAVGAAWAVMMRKASDSFDGFDGFNAELERLKSHSLRLRFPATGRSSVQYQSSRSILEYSAYRLENFQIAIIRSIANISRQINGSQTAIHPSTLDGAAASTTAPLSPHFEAGAVDDVDKSLSRGSVA